MVTRRQFNIGAVALAFAGLTRSGLGQANTTAQLKAAKGYGLLKTDPEELLDLPEGFSYQVISALGDAMDDGLHVPDRADGMGCFAVEGDASRVVLVRNHEIHPKSLDEQPDSIKQHKSVNAYDSYKNGVALPGGTTSIVYNLDTAKTERQFVSLTGTIRNCAGGQTPWGSWLSCEESVDRAGGQISQDHGYVFEVLSTARQTSKPVPIKAMGRFNHEAVAIDPDTGIAYMTEDRGDGLFYRYVPNEYGKLLKGGTLQALAIKGTAKFDSRNWEASRMPVGEWLQAEWVTLESPESPGDDLRKQGLSKGATLFARGEGVHWGNKELYFCCTNGGNAQLGQVMRYQPDANGGRLQLFYESQHRSMYNFGDNLTVMPTGDLLVCEDQYTAIVDNHLRGVTPEGNVYAFARLREQTELAGACFSPDGSTLFVNIYSPAKTLAIRGPW